MQTTTRCYSVYQHKSPSGKLYFGITSRSPKQRWNNGNGYRENSYFWSAIKKYGWGNFEHIILASDLSEQEACDMEVKLIAEYKSNNPLYGYNLSRGGEGVYDRCGKNNTNYRHGMCVGGYSKEYKSFESKKSYQAHREERLAKQNEYSKAHREHKRWYDKVHYWEEELLRADTDERVEECLNKLNWLKENEQ